MTAPAPAGRAARAIRAARPAKEVVDPWRPLAVVREDERTTGGVAVPTVTVFLAGAECPFTCVFCDLWRHTLDGPTPEGALPRQLELALEELGAVPPHARLKLYNASNFFDDRAVPPADLGPLAELASAFERVIVECHPRLIDHRCVEFSRRLEGRLEVAMGLECVHPEALARLNKGMTLDDWERAAARLNDAGIPFRAFVLIGAPFVPEDGRLDWTLISATHALESGAETVSLIPLRGNAELERWAGPGSFREPDLEEIEEALGRALELGRSFTPETPRAVLLDTWDLERFAAASGCPGCREPRLARLRRMNLSAAVEARVACEACAPR